MVVGWSLMGGGGRKLIGLLQLLLFFVLQSERRGLENPHLLVPWHCDHSWLWETEWEENTWRQTRGAPAWMSSWPSCISYAVAPVVPAWL